MEHGFGKVSRDQPLAQRDLNMAAAGRRFRRDPWLVVGEQDKQAPPALACSTASAEAS